MASLKWIAAAGIFLLAPGCDRADSNEAAMDVLDQHEDVVEQARRTPDDTALIAEQVRQRDEALDEAAEATRREVEEKLGDTTRVN